MTEIRTSPLLPFVGSVLDSIANTFGDGYVAERGLNLRILYTESHYALALILMHVLDGRDPAHLKRAEARLRKFETFGVPLLMFDAMAVCLCRIVARSHGASSPELDETLKRMCGGIAEGRRQAYSARCGNNMYTIQLVTDSVLRPLALGMPVSEEGLAILFDELARYRSAEGFYYDEPRSAATGTERLFPLAYCMKFLFLLGLAERLGGDKRLGELFCAGLKAAVPLMTSDGGFSYFGRTDNSTFANSLTLFNLRLGAILDPGSRDTYLDLARRQERIYLTTPRTSGGYLEVNRFDHRDGRQLAFSRDNYSRPSQYSIASCAYVLLSELLCPDPARDEPAAPAARTPVAHSRDLGILRLTGGKTELFLRTVNQLHSCDRRYFGPTILRLTHRGRLLIGAVPRTCSTDLTAAHRPASLASRILRNIRHVYARGVDHLDARLTGFIPVLVKGSAAYIPEKLTRDSIDGLSTEFEYAMGKIPLRGIRPALAHCLLTAKVAAGQSYDPVAPAIVLQQEMKLVRRVELSEECVTIKDEIRGNLRGKTLYFTTRSFPEAAIEVTGLMEANTLTGWGSDGVQEMRLYSTRCTGDEIAYRILIPTAP